MSMDTSASPKKKRTSTKTTIQTQRLGKDEMNLAEYPFALLKRSTDATVLYFEFEKVHPSTGKVLKAHWRVNGDPEHGMPGPIEERLYMILMELTREQNFPEKVHFSRSDLLDRLGIKKNARAYEDLRLAFLRLRGVQIEARNCFWDNSSKTLAASKMFQILTEVTIHDEGGGQRKGQIPLALSYFEWHKVMQESFANGYIRSVDIAFALSLKSWVATRLFRFLDKHRTVGEDGVRSKYEIGIFKLCEQHLGILNVRYASKLKDRLADAHQELIERGYLASVNYEEMKTAPGEVKVVYYFTNKAVEQLTPTSDLERVVANALPVAESAPVVPSLLDIMVGIDRADPQQLDSAIDAVFDILNDEEKEKILERAKSGMPDFLRNNLRSEGAQLTLNRLRRQSVKADYPAAVEGVLKARAEQK